MAAKMNGLSREYIIHPGETLKEVLEDCGMTQKELAVRTDVTETHISHLINCQKDISVSFAKKLEYALAVDAGFWINLQANYDKELADFEEVNKISNQEYEIMKKLKEITTYMQQVGVLEKESNKPGLVIQLKKKLGVSNLTRIPDLSQVGACRLAASVNTDPYVLFTWLKLCDLVNEKYVINKPLDLEKLKTKLALIKELMFEHMPGIHLELRKLFAGCGIKFLIVRHFRGAPVQGVIKKCDGGSLDLIITNRYKFADIFWFTLFHEIGHIINEDFADRLIDYENAENEAEKRADEFASNALIDKTQYQEFVKNGDFSLDQIKRFCLRIGIPGYILIGRLQREGYLKYHHYVDEKVKYELEDLEVTGS